ncbi:MAG: TIGR02710 family CRISPR-associated protein [Chloroflexaceae bacterium]|nr:TIGR02710 family CRISPR-associated protein [Chloroflexaceae bacterium]
MERLRRRREAQGRYDVAALCLYRCLELLSQQRLALWGISTDRPDFAAALRRKPRLEDRYRDVSRAQGRRRFYGLPDRSFGLFVGYMLLAALDDQLVADYPIDQIERQTHVRNQSILAHGFRLITETEYDSFREIVETLLDRFFAVLATDRAFWEATYHLYNPSPPRRLNDTRERRQQTQQLANVSPAPAAATPAHSRPG